MVEVKKVIGNVTLSVYDAGVFKTDEGKQINFDEGIKIKVGKQALKISARDLLALKAVLNDGSIREELQKRYDIEEEILKDMTF